MKKTENAAISPLRIFLISIIFIFIFTFGVRAANSKLNTVKIIFSTDYELTVFTAKTTVKDILDERNIVLSEDEVVTPSLENTITDSNTIKISKASENTNIELETNTLNTETIIENYIPIVEKYVTEQEEIPFETITKDDSNGESTTNKVIQQGKNGLKEVVYKVKYKNDIEIERIEVSSTIIEEPVDKIIQIKNKTTSRSSGSRTSTDNPATSSASKLAKKVENITPVVKTLNTSAYTASSCGKSSSSSSYGVTASGASASAWYTVAAGKGYKLGTIIYIPYFKDKPNGGWFVVQDRGGAISNNKLDVYMNTYNECKQFGRKNLTCYIYEM